MWLVCLHERRFSRALWPPWCALWKSPKQHQKNIVIFPCPTITFHLWDCWRAPQHFKVPSMWDRMQLQRQWKGLTTLSSTGQIRACLFLVFQNRSRLEFASSWPKMPMWFIGGLCYTTLQNSHYKCGLNPTTKSLLLRFKGSCDAQTPLIKIQFYCWLLCNSRTVGLHHEAVWCSLREFQFWRSWVSLFAVADNSAHKTWFIVNAYFLRKAFCSCCQCC